MRNKREYFVYRYQYSDMREPKWEAMNAKYGVDSLPPTVLAKPGLLRISAYNKKEALYIGKAQFNHERC